MDVYLSSRHFIQTACCVEVVLPYTLISYYGPFKER